MPELGAEPPVVDLSRLLICPGQVIVEEGEELDTLPVVRPINDELVLLCLIEAKDLLIVRYRA